MNPLPRQIIPLIQRDLNKKMVFLTGPRQAGKTTVAEMIAQHQPNALLLNFDVHSDRAIIQGQSWDPTAPLVVFDELHKMPNWRTWLKGVYDGRSPSQAILVTGSTRLDAFRQAGESLAGRYYAWRLMPLTVQELVHAGRLEPEEALARLLERGGFPEPFLTPNPSNADRWRKLYLEGLIRDDILEFSRIQDIRTMRLFVDVLRACVGSTVSLASIVRDLQVSHAKLSSYLSILEALHIVFVIRPHHKNIGRSLLKEPKVYFYDTGLVTGSEGARFENAVATMLHAHCLFQADALGKDTELRYIRNKDGNEVDFVLTDRDIPTHFVEAKWQDPKPARYLMKLAKAFPEADTIQLVRHLRHRHHTAGVWIEPAATWLAALSNPVPE